MGRLTEEDRAIRRQIAAWLKHLYHENEPIYGTREAFAEAAHIPKSTVTDALNGKEDIGLGVNILYNMRRYLHANINLVLDGHPPAVAAEQDKKSRSAP